MTMRLVHVSPVYLVISFWSSIYRKLGKGSRKVVSDGNICDVLAKTERREEEGKELKA